MIRDGVNGLLVDFFSPAQLAEAVAELIRQPDRARALGMAARQTVLDHYSLEHCVPRHLSLLQLVASGALK